MKASLILLLLMSESESMHQERRSDYTDQINDYESYEQGESLEARAFLEIKNVEERTISVRDLRNRRRLPESICEKQRSANIPKKLVNFFLDNSEFKGVEEDQLSPQDRIHKARLLEIQEMANRQGTTKHLQLLFGRSSDEEIERMNRKNRERAQHLIATKSIGEVLRDKHIPTQKSVYITSFYSYMYRLNYPQITNKVTPPSKKKPKAV